MLQITVEPATRYTASEFFARTLFTGFVRVLENLESHGNLKFQNPGLQNLENMCWSLKVLENYIFPRIVNKFFFIFFAHIFKFFVGDK